MFQWEKKSGSAREERVNSALEDDIETLPDTVESDFMSTVSMDLQDLKI